MKWFLCALSPLCLAPHSVAVDAGAETEGGLQRGGGKRLEGEGVLRAPGWVWQRGLRPSHKQSTVPPNNPFYFRWRLRLFPPKALQEKRKLLDYK